MILIVVILIGFLVIYFVAGAIRALWQSHEEAKQEAERERFERIVQASTPREWPTPKGPHGFNRNRRAS